VDESANFDKDVSALEVRLGHVETKIHLIDRLLQQIEPAIQEMAMEFGDLADKVSSLAIRVGRMEGQLRAVPAFLQLMVALISTWAAGTAIVFALLKATH
jgi:uncharacterized coiled-coil protein SlyX